MSLVMATTPGLVLCAPLAECAAWGRCARSRPADVTARQQPAFKHFGPRPDGQRCGAFIDSWAAAEKHGQGQGQGQETTEVS